ncbi:MAG: hypothetical protein ACI9KE_005093 [Polyangiales bacterium]
MSEPLFCPFCSECFEDVARCPDHDIPLVGFEELQKTRGRVAPSEEDAVEAYSPRYGRVFLMAAAFLWLLGFALPFVAIPERGAVSGFALASASALNLWMVPALAFAVLSVLARRRTPAAMQSARIAVGVLAGGVGASLGFTLYRVYNTTHLLVERLGHTIEVVPRAGVFVIGAGVVLGLFGALRFGTLKDAPPTYRVE